MPFTEESEKKKLYEFDGSYLTELNQIRKQLNLVTISDDEEESNLDIQVPPTPKFTFNEELYDCNTDYMKELNEIRKQLNLKEIVESGKETKTLFINNGAVRRNKKPRKVAQLDANYTPPKKKQRNSRDSSPSENSSPVRENPYEFSDFSPVKTNFCSLNVPTCESPQVKPKSKVTILVDDEGISPTWLTTSLEIPRIAKDFHAFPSIVHIDKWASIFTHEANEIFSPSKSDISKRVRKKVSLGESKAIETFPQIHDQKIENKMLEVETISSLNNMYHVKRKSNDVRHVEETVNLSDDESKSESGEEVKVGCRCFSICFNKKSPNFFS